LFDLCKSRFEQASTPAERDDYLLALGSFRDPALQEEALRYAMEGPLRPQEVFDIPTTIAQASEAESERIFQWCLDHYDVLGERLPPMYRSYLPMIAGGCSLTRLERAKVFFTDPARATPTVESRLARVSDSVNDCVSLRQRDGDKVARYLARVSDGGTEGAQTGAAEPGTH